MCTTGTLQEVFAQILTSPVWDSPCVQCLVMIEHVQTTAAGPAELGCLSTHTAPFLDVFGKQAKQNKQILDTMHSPGWSGCV